MVPTQFETLRARVVELYAIFGLAQLVTPVTAKLPVEIVIVVGKVIIKYPDIGTGLVSTNEN